ncbi:hypothetical protein [Demequina globuliformis]|uniref:hypothetical protein n=1 Tax=Demequina globuliformis TaxID=676202 RepID=UPI0007860309|nr:hypothetical protein [Demequina globuliformis]
MNDMFDGLHRSAARHGETMAARMDPDAVAERTHDAIAAGRRRRTQGHAALAIAAVGLVGAGVWAVQPHHPEPADELVDARVGTVDVVPGDFGDMGCFRDGAPAYVPWTEPGVTIASEDVLRLGLQVEATFYRWGEGDNVEAFDPGPHFDASRSAHGDVDPVGWGAQFTVSWEGDAPYTVEAAAFLVSEGRVVSDFYAWDSPIVGDVAPQDWKGYAAPSNTTTTYVGADVNTANCLRGDGDDPVGLVPAEQAVVHTLVQVQDEAGVPLATYVDANGIDGLTVSYPDAVEAGLGVDIEPVTDDEVVAERARRADIGPTAPAEVALAEALASDGQPLEQAGAGLSGPSKCGVPVAEPVAQAVLPVDVDVPPAPATVSLSELHADPAAAAEVTEPTFGTPGVLHFIDQDGDQVGHMPATFGPDGDAWVIDVTPALCAEVQGIVPGTYTVVAEVGEVASVIGQQTWNTFWEINHADPVAWAVIGTTVVEDE